MKNIELLTDLYRIWSPSCKENKMREFICGYLAEHNINFKVDEVGNIYATKGVSDNYPCDVCHIDQVQTGYPKDYELKVADDYVFAFSSAKRTQCGLGADDKNGIYCAIECLLTLDCCKAAFFIGEEIGCVGSGHADMDFFNDCYVVLEADRRGKSNLITSIGCTNLCSEEFLEAIKPLYTARGYDPTDGCMTDVLALKENGLGVCCLNISCGYYEPHTEHEITCLSDLNNCLQLMLEIMASTKDINTKHILYDGDYCNYRYNKSNDYYDDYTDEWEMYDHVFDIIYAAIKDGGTEDDIRKMVFYLYPEMTNATFDGIYAGIKRTF